MSPPQNHGYRGKYLPPPESDPEMEERILARLKEILPEQTKAAVKASIPPKNHTNFILLAKVIGGTALTAGAFVAGFIIKLQNQPTPPEDIVVRVEMQRKLDELQKNVRDTNNELKKIDKKHESHIKILASQNCRMGNKVDGQPCTAVVCDEITKLGKPCISSQTPWNKEE